MSEIVGKFYWNCSGARNRGVRSKSERKRRRKESHWNLGLAQNRWALKREAHTINHSLELIQQRVSLVRKTVPDRIEPYFRFSSVPSVQLQAFKRRTMIIL